MDLKFKLPVFARRIILMRKQSWIRNREGAFEQLLADCINEREISLLLALLTRFKYIYQTEYNNLIMQLCNQVVRVWNLAEANTQLVAQQISYPSDSSQVVLYDVRRLISSLGWYHPHHCSMITKSVRHAASRPNIVIFDEFLGSGDTLSGNIDSLKKVLAEKVDLSNISIKICVIAAMRDGYHKLRNLGYDIFAPIILDKGISSHLEIADRQIAITDMLRIESILAPRIHEKSLPSLGYSGSESLYGREYGNAVTNVFPIFWWQQYVDARFRKTLLTRTK